ncbi:MAG TPA: DUF4783 domain-containing protein [Puia sp.]|jgi:hypothetical protein|nr:DUF4783 domain-containing protein [Puia sp.]
MKSVVMRVGGVLVVMVMLVLVSFRPVYTLDDITYAIRLGNAGELSRYLDNRVDISLPEKSDNYSKIQAEMIIRDFFTTNGVRNFVVRKMGYSGSAEYCVGVLQTKNGDYRTTIFTRQKGDRLLLEELRFQVNQ